MNESRLETLVIARSSVAREPLELAQLSDSLRRFSSTTLSDGQWSELVTRVVQQLLDREVLDSSHRLRDRNELVSRIGAHDAKRWQQLSDRYLPGLALDVAPGDKNVHKRLASRDDWAAAIVGRVLGLWSGGTPPSLPAVCDALAWRELGLVGKPKRFPPEVRALFMQRRLGSDAATPERQVRLLAAREVEAPRAEGRTLRDALVRGWLHDRELAKPTTPAFEDAVRGVAREARDGLFGDRKVFISAAWHALRQNPHWAGLTLPDFKTRLLSAHRTGTIVLARADFVAAMDPALVAASETITDGASFHFIVRGEVS